MRLNRHKKCLQTFFDVGKNVFQNLLISRALTNAIDSFQKMFANIF